MINASQLSARVTDVERPRAAPSSLALTDLIGAETTAEGTALSILADWVRHYLMQPHPDLGRLGHVCPFTARAARLGTIRIGISDLGAENPDAILATMQDALRAFDAIPCPPKMRQYRTVIVGFPACAAPGGVAALKQTQRALRHHSILRAKMIGLFEPDSNDTGLINPAFRPLRCPIPTLAIRMLVPNDVPFVVRNPLLTPIFLLKFPLTSLKRLLPAFYGRLRVAR